MWYEKFHGLPPKGSLLESLFMLIYLQKKQAELLSTRALVQVSMPDEREAQDPAIEAFQKYCDQMFPFLERATNSDQEEARKRLLEFTKKPVRIPLKPIWKMQAQQAKKMASLKQFAVKPKVPGAPEPYKEAKPHES